MGPVVARRNWRVRTRSGSLRGAALAAAAGHPDRRRALPASAAGTLAARRHRADRARVARLDLAPPGCALDRPARMDLGFPGDAVRAVAASQPWTWSRRSRLRS